MFKSEVDKRTFFFNEVLLKVSMGHKIKLLDVIVMVLCEILKNQYL